MPRRKSASLKQLYRRNQIRSAFRQIVAILSLIVVILVSWELKLTGITMAGEAFCGMDEHIHGEACPTRNLICSEEAVPPHSHDESCILREMICQLPESPSHFHGEACYNSADGSLTCPFEETEGHSHTDSCWIQGIGFGCGQYEADGHIHTSDCLTGDTQLACGKEATAGHVHSDSCFEILDTCPLEEHIHDASCYSDISADLETEDDWIRTLPQLYFTADKPENLVEVAKSQLGYTESTLNFQVDTNGIRRGITRYGQWYGNPYGDWSAMFVSFCLHYAGADNLPVNAGPEAMLLEWDQEGLYRDTLDHIPEAGNILFLTKETELEDPSEFESVKASFFETSRPANAVAVITDVSGDVLTVIEGNLNNSVAETTYSISDPEIKGYGVVPSRKTLSSVNTLAADGAVTVAQTINYSDQMFTSSRCFIVYTQSGGRYFAFDGNGKAVEITIDSAGNILTDVPDSNSLFWTFTGGNNSYSIRNLSTGRYMHAYPNNGGGVTTSNEYTSILERSGNGVKIRSNSQYARLDTESGSFVLTHTANEAAVYQFGVQEVCTVWLDGTAGGQGQLGGSPNQSYTVARGSSFLLPESWQSPKKYEQKIRGWYDVTNHTYYAPGTEVSATGNMVFYADWVAATYDIGQYNEKTVNTVSTNAFITTHVFDYNYLFNVMSANPTISVDSGSHSETWRMVQNGRVQFNNQESLEFVFIDYDGSSRLPDMANRGDNNNYHGVGVITQGIYTPELAEILFGTDNELDPKTGEGIIGKTYLGTGDYLFQFMSDPSDEHFGYYYYDSQRNAASFNESEGRFYVYEYLEATSDSVNSDIKSDFLPLNSPYANTAGNTVRTYTYEGDHGEYNGTVHYRYDSKYSDDNNDTGYVHTNYAFGTKMDVKFYLPNDPGQTDADGNTGNKDIYGNDMHFQFNGDDDVWVLVDDTLVLDIGGIHGIEGGDINFATGTVTVNGNVDEDLTAALKTITAGEHTLTIMYLERGSSQSNSAFYFNLAPRFSLTIQKEDVLTQELLDGAQFTVYTDSACTKPAKLYSSEEAYNAGETSRSTFTIENGATYMWGLASGNTYYIRETKAPDAEGYGIAKGIIKLTIDKDGQATYHVEVINDPDGSAPSGGFTVHGVRIDEETQSAYITVTNAPESVRETTTVQVYKKWEDSADHSSDYILAYLTVTDPDGTIRRIREITLSNENGWMYTWTNLPKYDYDHLAEVQYGIEESYESGYYSTVRKVTEISVENTYWAEAYELKNGQTYLIRSSSGYLSTLGAGSDTGYKWVNSEEAQSSVYAQWTAHSSGQTFKLTNKAGQTITFYYGNGSPTDFFASTGGESNNAKQYFKLRKESTGSKLYYDAPNNQDYYLVSSMNNSGKFGYNTRYQEGMVLNFYTLVTEQEIIKPENWAYQITNTPLDKSNETSLTVKKLWDLRNSHDGESAYKQSQVTIKLLANGVQTGRAVTLNLKNSWSDTFQGLPYRDTEGNVITYTVTESWDTDNWTPVYGEIVVIDGNVPSYSTTITNVYRLGGGPMLPSTGSPARLLYMLCGGGIMLATLVCGFGIRRKRERRMK